MKVTVYGLGYVGLVSAACLAKLGHVVTGTDINEARIQLLQQGICPIYEESLAALLQEQMQQQKLKFTHDLKQASKESSLHVIATGTPSKAKGEVDLSQIEAVISHLLNTLEVDAIVVIKSTVPVGTNEAIQEQINTRLKQHAKPITIHVVSNPEFLREGTAVFDFLEASRIIIGGKREIENPLRKLYAPLIEKGIPFLRMSWQSAELSKYAANAMLACRISFMNKMSELAEQFNANVEEIREAMALDERIGPYFLQAGIGFGGSCFPKDVKALIHLGKSRQLSVDLFESIERINTQQKQWMLVKMQSHFAGKLKGLKVGIWGLAFKPQTDDLREASSLTIIEGLLKQDSELHLFDPVAMPLAKKYFQNEAMLWYPSASSVLSAKLDALLIVTEWADFKNFPLERLKKELGFAPIFDGRNCFCLNEMKQLGFIYYSVGRPVVNHQAQMDEELSFI